MDGQAQAFKSAAAAVTRAVLSCEVSEDISRQLNNAFSCATSLRLCLVATRGGGTLISSNMLACGDLLFTPVPAVASGAAAATAQCTPLFLTKQGAARWGDLGLLTTRDSAGALFCVPLPPDPDGPDVAQSSSGATAACLGAVAVGFTSETAIAEGDLRAALLLAREIAVHHSDALTSLLSGVETAFTPDMHAQWGDAGGLVRPPPVVRNSGGSGLAQLRLSPLDVDADAASHSSSGASTPTTDSAESSSGGDPLAADRDGSGAGALVLNPAQHRLFASARRWSLSFPNRILERQYRTWRRGRMARVDAAALATVLAYHVVRGSTTARGAGGSAQPGATSDWAPAAAVAVALALAAAPPARKWYARRRNWVLAALYVVLGWHQAAMRHGVAAADGGPAATPPNGPDMWQHLAYGAEGMWIAVLSVILHVQHPWQVALLAWAAAGWAAAVPPACPAGLALAPCWGIVAVRVLAVQVLLPAAILYFLERGARRAFCATPMASAWAWAPDMDGQKLQ